MSVSGIMSLALCELCLVHQGTGALGQGLKLLICFGEGILLGTVCDLTCFKPVSREASNTIHFLVYRSLKNGVVSLSLVDLCCVQASMGTMAWSWGRFSCQHAAKDALKVGSFSARTSLISEWKSLGRALSQGTNLKNEEEITKHQPKEFKVS